ncbi:hypothetical protein HS088_TW05G00253 [Tripterygium wilfordii]|uniref:Uncharacterized protein n=1 Tax=Tripterygium wilfordii TaxID=458696 RepID=A0A7J7DMD0_TRIWF|nr:uncharacterized protein LOC119998078 [Tripterygium wilfordii]KAF5747530.1 hypothetical protein HS088_TW05G00253 [Tripterygium wilfordii]
MLADVSCHDNEELSEALLIDETRELNRKSGMNLDFEFGPLEHPMEPPEEDRPVKCPMPSSSVINMDREMHEERQCFRKTAESPAGVNMEGIVSETTEPPERAARKRHHKLTHGDHIITPLPRIPPFPPLPSQKF